MPLGTEVGLGPGDIVLDERTQLLPLRKGARQPLTFRPMSIVVTRSPISAAAELATFDVRGGYASVNGGGSPEELTVTGLALALGGPARLHSIKYIYISREA